MTIAAADENNASTRIRHDAFIRYLPEDIVISDSPDVLYIQKCYDKKTLKIVKDLEIPLVYDIDGNTNKDIQWMMKQATIVTTDTKERVDLLKNKVDCIVKVIPDSIDYFTSFPPLKFVNKFIKRIGTFGAWPSVEAAFPFMPKNSYYCTDKPRGMINSRYFTKWELSTFPQWLRGLDLAILIQGEYKGGKNVKSPHRLLTSMAAGVFTIVNDGVSYSEIMENAYHPELIVKHSSDITKRLKMPKKDREKTVNDCYEYVWNNHSPQKSSHIFAEEIRHAEKIGKKIHNE